MKLTLTNLLIYIILFVDLLNLSFAITLTIQIVVRLALLGFYIYIIWKNKVNIFNGSAFKEIIIFLPFFLICFSNIFASLIGGGFNFVKSSGLILLLQIVLCLVGAILEEIVFRLFVQTSLVNHRPISRILLSALIFALCHLINIVNVRSVDALLGVLLQTIYTFGLGLVLGFIFEYSHSLVFVMVLHFAFNLFNDVLFCHYDLFQLILLFILKILKYKIK